MNIFQVDSVPLNPSTLIICISDYHVHKYQGEFFKAEPHFLIFCKALQHTFLSFFFSTDVEMRIYMTFLSSESDLIFLFKHATYLVFLQTFSFMAQFSKAFKHRLNHQANQAHNHIKLIQTHTSKLIPKYVTILSPHLQNTSSPSIFRKSSSFHLIKVFIFLCSFRSHKSKNYFYQTIVLTHLKIKIYLWCF